MTEGVAQVYAAIAAVQKGLSKLGIAKDRKNVQQGYAFRGIDDVYNALAPLLAEHGLCILPRVLSRVVTERRTKQDTALFSVVVDMEFDLVSAADGSKHTIRTIGEAMDSGDKATNKAMSAAYKYACLQTFAIPTEGDNDADATTHTVEVEARASSAAPGVTMLKVKAGELGSTGHSEPAPPPNKEAMWPGNCPDHRKPFRLGPKGGYYCPTKVGAGWCKQHPIAKGAAGMPDEPPDDTVGF